MELLTLIDHLHVSVCYLQITSHINTLFKKADKFSRGGLSVGQWGDIFALEMAKKGVKNHRKKIEVRNFLLICCCSLAARLPSGASFFQKQIPGRANDMHYACCWYRYLLHFRLLSPRGTCKILF